MEISTEQKLQDYITAELVDAALYKELIKMTDNKDYKELLEEFSSEEEDHAKEFQRIYKIMTGEPWEPRVKIPPLVGAFEEILKNRILDESGDYRKYGNEYLNTFRNPILKRAYYQAGTDENVHALRILYILNSL